MQPDPLDERAVMTRARLAGLEVPEGDIALLTFALRRYSKIIGALDGADLDGTEMPVSNDPRVGW